MSSVGLSQLRTQQQLLWVWGRLRGNRAPPASGCTRWSPQWRPPHWRKACTDPGPLQVLPLSPQATARAAGGGFGTRRLFMHQPSPPAFQLNPEDFGDIMAQLCMCYYVEEREEKKHHTKQIFQMWLAALGIRLLLRLVTLKVSIH